MGRNTGARDIQVRMTNDRYPAIKCPPPHPVTRKTMISIALLLLSGSAHALELESSDMKANAPIKDAHAFAGFGCTGDNKSPALSWKKAPEGTKSFALLVHDADAPTGGAGWWHWVMIDIPPAINSLSTGQKAPEGAREIKTDFGSVGWGGPCPPEGHGVHHYSFSIHALSVDKLEIPEGATASLVGYMVNGNTLEKATFVGTYER
jgi:Raf kinase inhibitor-like YbhB/YbcL family protein